MSPVSASAQSHVTRRERLLSAYPRPARGAALVLAGSPAPYRVGMSNLGFHFIYERLRRSSRMRTERFFADTAPRTIESGAPISSAALVFVSISYEEDYLNLARILLASGIAPLAADRRSGPVIIAGGPAPGANPFPLAEMVDCFVLGEGEEPLDALVAIIEANPRAEPRALLAEFARVDAVLVPGISVGRVAHARPAAPTVFPHSVMTTPHTVFPDTLLVEIGRGCPGSCSFCLASSLYGPYRALPARSLADLFDSIETLPRAVGLVSTAVAAHPDFPAVMRACTSRFARTALSSIRAEDLDESKAGLIGEAGIRSVSFAPESGSESLRFRLGKRVVDDVYIDRARMLREAGVRSFRLYLLAGCPGERERDEREAGGFLKRFGKAVRGCRVSVNINILVPKAWTPMQFHAMPSERELDARLSRMRAICAELGMTVRTKSVRSAVRQAILSLGDVRTGRAILRYAGGGISWKRSLAEAGVDPGLPHERRDPGAPLPWDAVDGPVERAFLRRRYRRLIGSTDDA